MLELKNIVKEYEAGGTRVQALRGIDLAFRESEFVAVLGPSGCGKTTLLNLIGGLDRYTSGDLVIDGVSTKQYRDSDWDTYRNHSVGFVFQNYNLIPHQSVLSNVELALTLSGVPKAERRRRAKQALEEVGLGDQLQKKPNQMSGGQMQRVAIARALVNDPDIVLADEPTGALDSETSVQVMELLKQVARDRLVIMVTHNPDLAERYATRTVRLLDGRVTDDSAPYTVGELTAPKEKKTGRTSMSFSTAVSLSLKNLMTKKTRTLLTAFAGSIGIIGIALILSLSNGIQDYINQVQEDTLSSYPLAIEAETVDLSSVLSTMTGVHQEQSSQEAPDDDAVYANTVMYELMNSMTSMETEQNDLVAFREYLESPDCPLRQYTSAISYSYAAEPAVYTQQADGAILRSDLEQLMEQAMTDVYGDGASSMYAMASQFSNLKLWEELLPGEGDQMVSDLVQEQYDVVYGHWPQSYDEVVLVVDEHNRVPDMVLYALGYKSREELAELLRATMEQEQIDTGEDESWSYETLCETPLKLILPAACYRYDEAAGTYTDISATDAGMDYLYNSDTVGVPLKICGIVRPGGDSVANMLTGNLCYTTALTDYIMEQTAQMDVVIDQKAQPDTDVLTGLPFRDQAELPQTDAEKRAAVEAYLKDRPEAERAEAYLEAASQPSQAQVDQTVQENLEGMTREYIEQTLLEQYAQQMGTDAEEVRSYIAGMDDATLYSYVEDEMAAAVREQYAAAARETMAGMGQAQLAAALDGGQLTDEQYAYLYDTVLPPMISDTTYQENLERLGSADPEHPSAINLYAATFADKDAISDAISAYNDTVPEEQQITYTDYVALLMSSITTIINAITYVLIAFVAISLIVSSIMIGIITYISVLERTKEIGILRAIGASKRDISRVFNAETLLEGLASGLLGVGVTLILIWPINLIIRHLSGIAAIGAALPVVGGVVLVVISMLLTLIAGLIPARIAARKDPVTALRTE